MHEPSLLAAELCPLCGQSNGCAMDAQRLTGLPQPPCWCSEVEFSAELIASVPEPARRRVCICRACATGTRPD